MPSAAGKLRRGGGNRGAVAVKNRNHPLPEARLDALSLRDY
jgi:hypothetical protein